MADAESAARDAVACGRKRTQKLGVACRTATSRDSFVDDLGEPMPPEVVLKIHGRVQGVRALESLSPRRRSKASKCSDPLKRSLPFLRSRAARQRNLRHQRLPFGAAEGRPPTGTIAIPRLRACGRYARNDSVLQLPDRDRARIQI